METMVPWIGDLASKAMLVLRRAVLYIWNYIHILASKRITVPFAWELDDGWKEPTGFVNVKSSVNAKQEILLAGK